MNFSELQNSINGETIKFTNESDFQYLITDSRKLQMADDALFFAIIGENHDGHKYIQELYEKGVRQFVIQNKSYAGHYKSNPDILAGANIILVENTITALQQVASFHRGQFNLPIMAITGSNGKTIVKEWLAQLLAKDFNIVRSPKSYNSQIGVPLSVWQINENHNFAIFEAGLSKTGEMQALEAIIKPKFGLFTNIGTAHDQGFENIAQKIAEKAILFKHCDYIFYCRDHEKIHEELINNYGAPGKLISWSKHANDSKLEVVKILKDSISASIELKCDNQDFIIAVPFADEASIENLIHCILVLLHFEVRPEEIQQRIKSLRPVSMRLELKQGINNCYLIDDTYNNDMAGLQLALDFMTQQKQRQKRTLILSDVLESGLPANRLYKLIASLIKQKGINRLIGIGPEISKYYGLFDSDSSFYPDTQSFIKNLKETPFVNELVLLKGGRVFEFERIIKTLQQKIHGTILEIKLDALVHNLNFYRSKLLSGTKLMVMVKALAYGSGSYEIANLLQFHNVDYLGVAYADEGVALRENGISLPIMVLNPSEETFEAMVAYNLEPDIYSLEILHAFINFLELRKAVSLIHIEIETGMHRLGFDQNMVPELIGLLKNKKCVSVASIFTHLAGADEAQHETYSRQQIAQFDEISGSIESAIGYKVLKHAVNSPGIIRFPEAHFDMVRLGIGLYGIEVTDKEQDALQPISTLKTTISQIKHIEPGETVGYGRWGEAKTAKKIATIAIGYADGYSRAFSKGVGKVLINGKIAPVIGNVCMDMTMVDITGIDAQAGNEVILFGSGLSIKEIARSINTIPYEILTNVSERVKRVFYKE